MLRNEKDEISPVKYPFYSQVCSAINGGKCVCVFVSGTGRFGEHFDVKASSILQCHCQAILDVMVYLFLLLFVLLLKIFVTFRPSLFSVYGRTQNKIYLHPGFKNSNETMQVKLKAKPKQRNPSKNKLCQGNLVTDVYDVLFYSTKSD